MRTFFSQAWQTFWCIVGWHDWYDQGDCTYCPAKKDTDDRAAEAAPVDEQDPPTQ